MNFQRAQEEICRGLEALEPRARFREDEWEREGGGGGRTRVLTGGEVFEKAGVAWSEVFGEFSEEFARQMPGEGRRFHATGVSVVLHPLSPHVPTCHANFRRLEHGSRRWFGGGADLTPFYFHAVDKEQFHRTWREVCDRHAAVADYREFAEACDRYFHLAHRRERRGVGGIFFDDMPLSAAAEAFVEEAAGSFLRAYLPIVERRKATPVTEEQRRWQELRRGRYVEFNLLYDRGTLFGLKTGGRTESILMSLPPRVRWGYDEEPAPGTPEALLLAELRR